MSFQDIMLSVPVRIVGLTWLVSSALSASAGAQGQDLPVTQGRAMDYGPAICHSVMFEKPADINARDWEGPVKRAWVVPLGDRVTVCYDLDRLALAAVWQGGLLDFSETHYNSYKGTGPPLPAGEVIYREADAAGCLADGQPLADPRMALRAYYFADSQVVLEYEVGDRLVRETPHLDDAPSKGPESTVVGRTFRVGGGSQEVAILIGGHAGGQARGDARRVVVDGDSVFLATLQSKPAATATATAADVVLESRDGLIYAVFAPVKASTLMTVWFRVASGGDEDVEKLPTRLADDHDPKRSIEGGPPRWTARHVTHGEPGSDEQAYTVDYLGVPELPYGAWMRLTGIAAIPELDVANRAQLVVTTLSGDVWVVSYHPDDLGEVHWKRFATGLYEPLGVLVSEDSIYVRGRDRITRLEDLNEDGEADRYENFHCQGDIGPGYHAFVFELLRDDEGCFYYVHSGRKSPSIGEVVRVRPDGRSWETIATRFRHPNGMGLGGPQNWLTIADNPDGSFPTGGMIIQRGCEYGQPTGPRTAPFLYLVPPAVDSSAGSQIWTDRVRWGPLGGSLIHTSFSKSTISYVLVQDNGFATNLASGVTKGRLPNGFAVKMPFHFRSGVMRGMVHPVDGQLYLAGQRGWDTNAAIDGCVARVRYTGKPAYVLSSAAVVEQGIRLTFSCELDLETVDYDNFAAERVGAGSEEVEIEDVVAIDDRTLLVEFLPDDLLGGGVIDQKKSGDDPQGRTHYRVLDPLAIEFRIRAADGTPIRETVYCTVNGIGE